MAHICRKVMIITQIKTCFHLKMMLKKMIRRLNKDLKDLDIVYGTLFKYCLSENHRDFEVIIESSPQIKYKILLKGVVNQVFESNIKSERFSMNDKYIQEEISPPINAWHWGIKSFEILNWALEEKTKELENASLNYNNYDFMKLTFNVSTATISFIFNDFKIIKI